MADFCDDAAVATDAVVSATCAACVCMTISLTLVFQIIGTAAARYSFITTFC